VSVLLLWTSIPFGDCGCFEKVVGGRTQNLKRGGCRWLTVSICVCIIHAIGCVMVMLRPNAGDSGPELRNGIDNIYPAYRASLT
jgi:hypothetical protein